MIGLLAIGLVAGVVAGISPCVLPVLPVVLVAGATEDAAERASARWRALTVIAGFIVSFTTFTLAGSALLSALHLPEDLLRDLGIGLLVVIGIGLLVPALGELVARPFGRVRPVTLQGGTSGFLLGLGLGTVFVPCAGPVLTAIVVVAATHQVGAASVGLTLAFSLGASIPLLIIAFAGGALVHRVATIKAHALLVRRVGGAVLIAMAVVLLTNVANGLQRSVPGYTSALQRHIEGTSYAAKQLTTLTTLPGAGSVNVSAACIASSSTLGECGKAPAFTGITAWLNTARGRPLTLASLRGKVVLVDFWTYSCINCQRSLPHVEAWYRDYRKDGFVVVGVHTPEFAFEHVVSNVRSAAAQLGVHYPIAIDNAYGTWDAYDNSAWPADYLIDAAGNIRAYSFGEGGYSTTESLIRDLLRAARPGIALPPATEVANKTPTEETTPETYLGYERLDNLAAGVVRSQPTRYTYPDALPYGDFEISGTWTINAQEETAGSDATLEYPVIAKDVYLVLGGSGTVGVTLGSGATRTIEVSGVPRLYTLVSSTTIIQDTLHLSFSPGVQAYDFTFG